LERTRKNRDARTQTQPPPMSGQKPGGKKEQMKFNTLAKTLVLGLAVLLATGAFASNKGSFHFEQSIVLNGQEIPAGDYTVRWEGTGPDVQLSVMKGKKEVAKTAAKMVELENKSSSDAIVLNNGGGTPAVSQFRFAGKKTALAIDSSDRASLSGSSSK
jgi:hypothetical protein